MRQGGLAKGQVVTEPKDVIWDTGFDHERQEPPKTEFTDVQALLHEGERVVTAEQAARDPAKVYCPLCLHPMVRHNSNGNLCLDCGCDPLEMRGI